MKPAHFTEVEYLNLSHLIAGGNISSSSKLDLERYAVMLCRPNAFTHFGAASFPQICETVRTLLIVRMSEQQNIEAFRISKVALRVARVALIISVLQTVFTIWSLLPKRETLSTIPVAILSALPLKNGVVLPPVSK